MLRILEPEERLTKIDRPLYGECNHCQSDGAPGIVVGFLNPTNLVLIGVSCLLCGQRYFIDARDVDEFYGPFKEVYRGKTVDDC